MADDIWGDDLELFLKAQNLPDSAFKPCPKCGSTWITRMAVDLTGKYTPGPSFFVGCLTCDCRTVNLDNPMEVVKRWNNREVYYPPVKKTIANEDKNKRNNRRRSVMKKLTNIFKKGIALLVAMAAITTAGLMPANTALAYNSGIEAFVNSLYADCLGRNADPTGFNDWCNKLATGQITGKQAAYGFFFSPEFQAKANAWSDTELINAYYKVFLNRGSDPSGASYWAQQISGTTNDISILFTGFADSAEFASKCASYGITVGAHVNVPTTVRGTSSGGSGGATGGVNVPGVTNGGYNATSAQALDDYWTSRGYEIFYIDLGYGATQKCYVKFNDMTEHNNQVNAWRNQNGLPSLAVITDSNDARYQYARARAVEVAYYFSHERPLDRVRPDWDCGKTNIAGETGENCFGGDAYNGISTNGGHGAFEAFRNSPMHNGAMLDDLAHSMVTASCSSVLFVASDGISVSSASPSSGYGASTVQLFYY